MQPDSRQRIGKDVYSNRVILAAVFSVRSVKSCYKKYN
jgi:hypothetical protein